MKRAFPHPRCSDGCCSWLWVYEALWVAPDRPDPGRCVTHLLLPCALGVDCFRISGVNFVASIVYLVRRNLKADAVALSAAEVGLVFCTVVLVTGPIWARPVWGIWWTWDWRLTSTLVMWLIYVSYLVLRRFSSGGQTPVLAAALAIFGGLDIPLVYFSIWFFRTQHPQPVIGDGGSIDPSMLHVWLINWGAFLCFGALVFWLRYRQAVQLQEIEEAEALESLLEARGA